MLASGEMIGRAARSDERPSQWETRLQLGHRLTRRLTGWIGYVHVATYQPGQPAGIEDQAVEQID